MINKTDGKTQVLRKINSYKGDNKFLAFDLHKLIMEINPKLKPRLWYGMPGYALSDKKPVLFFINVEKRVTFGVTEKASGYFKDASDSLLATSWVVTLLSEQAKNEIETILRSV